MVPLNRLPACQTFCLVTWPLILGPRRPLPLSINIILPVFARVSKMLNCSFNNLCGFALMLYWIIKRMPFFWPREWVWGIFVWFLSVLRPMPPNLSNLEKLSMCMWGRVCACINLASGNFLRQAQHKYLKIKSHPLGVRSGTSYGCPVGPQ